eukprot:TRINITY_DN1324_c0_g2_i1.p1 TRINITY_DN1324_c0_g2~~TRINITY_DN1324_c0_g2_i1.p1  ORF type:complete len:237 (+),score=55.96 TRINITY_DN1324_c0_g2_i1:382-1092(+)
MRSVAIAAFITASVVSAQQWMPAGDGDKRGPCPALNTLANHGYINRNGTGIIRNDLINAVYGVYNLDLPLTTNLVDLALGGVGYADANGNKVLDLDALDKHNFIEHDASLTRDDYADGDNHTPQASLIDQLKGLSADGETLGWNEMAKARHLRQQQEQDVDSAYTLDAEHTSLALGESITVLRILGTGDSMPLDWVDSWFTNEQIPDGWTKPATPYNSTQGAADNAKLSALVSALN